MLYLDMVPGNASINQIYTELKDTSENNGNRLIVLPIYGSEYILIKAFKNASIFKDRLPVDICLQKYKYYESPLYASEKTLEDYRTFERYCKLVLERNTIACACTESRIKFTGLKYQRNIVRNYFYTNDCVYGVDSNNKEVLHKDDKALLVLQALGTVPTGNKLENLQGMLLSEVWKVHRAAIAEVNLFIEKLKDVECLSKLVLESFEEIRVTKQL